MENIQRKIHALDISPLAKKVYLLVSSIPKGKVTTYKAIGDALGTKAYRAIGNILGKNPYIPAIPCHRVVASDGRLNGYAHGVKKKRKLLEAEGVVIEGETVPKTYIIESIIY